jgi:hypothetical protein
MTKMGALKFDMLFLAMIIHHLAILVEGEKIELERDWLYRWYPRHGLPLTPRHTHYRDQ